MGWVLFSFHLQRSYSLVVFDEVRECTWLGFPMCAAGGGSSTWGNTWESAYSLVVSDEVRECTWLGFFLPPAVRDSGRKNHLGE